MRERTRSRSKFQSAERPGGTSSPAKVVRPADWARPAGDPTQPIRCTECLHLVGVMVGRADGWQLDDVDACAHVDAEDVRRFFWTPRVHRAKLGLPLEVVRERRRRA